MTRLADRLDDAAWSRLDEAILTPALTHRPPMLPGAVEMLASLKALDLRIGLISNAGITPGVVLSRIMDDMGMGAHFDLTVFSDEVELSKPAAAIFQHALDEMGLAPDEAVFVGDQPLLDVSWARDAPACGWCRSATSNAPTSSRTPAYRRSTNWCRRCARWHC